MRIILFSYIYKFTRYIITKAVYLYQRISFKPRDLETAVEIGDKMLGSIFILKNIVYDFSIKPGMHVKIFDLVFPSPLIGSSFKSEEHVLESWLQMGMGGLIFKTVMENRRIGNSRPRLQDVQINEDRGLVNSLGLPGPGIDNFLDQTLKSRLWLYGRPLGLSIGGESTEDYFLSIETVNQRLTKFEYDYFYELNISCPNTKDGLTIGDNPQLLEYLIRKIRSNINTVISVKVSPDSPNKVLNEIAEICSSYQSIMINAGNTKFVNRESIGYSKSNFSMHGGGLSGPSLFPRTLEMTMLFSNYDIPIIATGGISNINHVNALYNAGASLFGMATSLVLDPYCIPRMNNMMKDYVHNRIA